jgi:TPR repeat protein
VWGGTTEDPAEAVVWLEKAAGLGDATAKAVLGSMLVDEHVYAGVAKQAARGYALVRQAYAQGDEPALCQIALCYLKGEGVEKDAAHAVTLFRQITTHGDAGNATKAQSELAACYATGNGVEADTVQAAWWCQRAAKAGDVVAIQNLAIIRKCDFCGSTPARKLCARCLKTRYCGPACIQGHWYRETDPHKGHCRRAADGGASTSTDGA